MQTFYFSSCIFSILADSRNQCALWAVSGYIYTGQASMDMDISMDIHAKSVDMDMDMDVKFHIHGNPAQVPFAQPISKPWLGQPDTDSTRFTVFYRAMHYCAKCGLPITCRLSVRPSLTLVDHDHIGGKS